MNFSRKARREILFIVLFFSAAPLVYFNFFGSGGFLRVRAHRAEAEELRQQNLQLRQEIQSLTEKIERVKNDPREIERIGREEYNLARPGDIIINLPESPD